MAPKGMEEEMEGAAWYKELLKPKAGHDSKAMMQASESADLTHAPFHGRLPGDISEPAVLFFSLALLS